jgi:hypothetical protein
MRPKAKEGYWPLVIFAESWFSASPAVKYSQYFYCDLDTGTCVTRIHRRKLMTPTGFYVMDEAYGLNSDRHNDEDSKECLVCLTDRKATLARPCKHVTLCNACAKVVMLGDRKCPLCRGIIEEVIPLQLQD